MAPISSLVVAVIAPFLITSCDARKRPHIPLGGTQTGPKPQELATDSSPQPRWRWYQDDGPLDGCDETGKYFNQSNGVDLWYTFCGPQNTKQVPILFQHGGSGSSHQFFKQTKELAKTRPLIMNDSRGQGRSPYKNFTEFHYDDIAHDVIALLDYLKIEKVAIMGWSDGGITGLNLAMNYSSRVDRIFALGPTANANMDNPGTNDPIIYSSTGSLNSNPPSGVTYSTQKKRADPAPYSCEALSPTPDKCDQMRSGINHMWDTEPNWGPDAFKLIKTPTWIVSGDHDTDILRSQYDGITAWTPYAGQLILPQVGHPAQQQDPTFMNFAIGNFMDLKFDGALPEY